MSTNQTLATGLGMDGVKLFPGLLSREAQENLVRDVGAIIRAAPLYRPEMPRTGKPFSVQMTNAGPLGWVSDKDGGYRYQAEHPVSGAPWPAMPDTLLHIWGLVANYPAPPECCLVNVYDASAKMSLHQDTDEEAMDAPVVSISLGDTALFRMKGESRTGKSWSVRLGSGDVIVFGGPARLAFHGIDRLYPGTSTLLPAGGRINLTLRRVSKIGP